MVKNHNISSVNTVGTCLMPCTVTRDLFLVGDQTPQTSEQQHLMAKT